MFALHFLTFGDFMQTQWPAEVKERLGNNTTYMKALLECSPYPLCLFDFNGKLITCNPAAVGVFGETIWLQSDIFGMSEVCAVHNACGAIRVAPEALAQCSPIGWC